MNSANHSTRTFRPNDEDAMFPAAETTNNRDARSHSSNEENVILAALVTSDNSDTRSHSSNDEDVIFGESRKVLHTKYLVHV
jgi:hypothetical protein